MPTIQSSNEVKGPSTKQKSPARDGAQLATRGISRLRIPAEDVLSWFTGTAAIIAGSDHFCLPFLEDKNLKGQKIESTGVPGLGVFGNDAWFGLVLTSQRRGRGGEEFHRHSAGDERQHTKRNV